MDNKSELQPISKEKSLELLQKISSVRELKKVILENGEFFLHKESLVRTLERYYKQCIVYNAVTVFSLRTIDEEEDHYFHSFLIFPNGSIKWQEINKKLFYV